MSIQINISHNSQAFIILTVMAITLHFGGNFAKKEILARPEFNVLKRNNHELHSTEIARTIPMIRKQNPKEISNPTFELSATDTVFAPNPPEPAKTAPNKILEPQAPDYFKQLIAENHIRIDAITNNGAIINGEFIPVQSPINEFAYPSSTYSNNQKMLKPLLYETNTETMTVTIREPVKPYRKHPIKSQNPL